MKNHYPFTRAGNTRCPAAADLVMGDSLGDGGNGGPVVCGEQRRL